MTSCCCSKCMSLPKATVVPAQLRRQRASYRLVTTSLVPYLPSVFRWVSLKCRDITFRLPPQHPVHAVAPQPMGCWYSRINTYSQEESLKWTTSGGQVKGQAYDYNKIRRVEKSPLIKEILRIAKITTTYILNSNIYTK